MSKEELEADDAKCDGDKGNCECSLHASKRKKKEENKACYKQTVQEINAMRDCRNEPMNCLCIFHSTRRDRGEYYQDTIERKRLETLQEEMNMPANLRNIAAQREKSLEDFYSVEELQLIDDNLEFGPRRTEEELYKAIAPKLSFDALTNRCCAICDCDYERKNIFYEEIVPHFIEVRPM